MKKEYWRKAKFDGKNYRIVKYYNDDCEGYMWNIYDEQGKWIREEACYNGVLEWLASGESSY